MGNNIAVRAFCEKNGIQNLNVKTSAELHLCHVAENPKTCHVPKALKDTLRSMKAIGEEFAYVVATSTLPNTQLQRLLIPVRDLKILQRTLDN